MKNSKLISTLKALSKIEMQRLGDFVRSPYFNKLRNVAKLYELLLKFYPEFESDELLKESVFRKIYPHENFNDSKLRNLISDLMNVTQRFLMQINFERDAFNTRFHLLNEYNKKGLFHHFELDLKKVEEILDNTKDKNEDFYYRKYILEQSKKFNLNRSQSQAIIIDDNEQKMTDYFIIFFLVTILQKYIYMLNQKKYIYDFDFNLSFLKQVIDHLKENRYDNIPLIRVLYNMLMIYVDGGENYFYALKKELTGYNNTLEKQTLVGIYSILSNYCFEKISNGESKFLNEDFELNKQSIEQDVYIERHTIPHIYFRSVVVSALRVNEIHWASMFIEKFKPRLHEEHKENMYNICRSMIEFHKKNFNESLEYLSNVKTEDISSKLDIKSLTARIYYELGYLESLISHIDNYRHFLITNPLVSELIKNIHGPFVSSLNKLINYKLNPDDYEFKKLKTEASNILDYNLKSWLLKKIEESE